MRKLIFFILVIFFISPACAEDLVVNGGFGTGDFTGWATGGNGDATSTCIVYEYQLYMGVYGTAVTGKKWINQSIDLTNVDNISFELSIENIDAANSYFTLAVGGTEPEFYIYSNNTEGGYGTVEVDVSGHSGVSDVYFITRVNSGAYCRAVVWVDDITASEVEGSPALVDGDFELGNYDNWPQGFDGSSSWPFTYSEFSLSYPYAGSHGLMVSAAAFDIPFSSYDHYENAYVTQTIDVTDFDALNFTAKMSSVGSSNTYGHSGVSVGGQVVYVTTSGWADYGVDVSGMSGEQLLTLFTYAESDGGSNDDRVQNLFIDDLVLTTTVPGGGGGESEPYYGPAYINFNPDVSSLNLTSVYDPCYGIQPIKFDYAVNASHTAIAQFVKYRDNWRELYGDGIPSTWTFQEIGKFTFDNVTLDYTTKCADGPITLEIELTYASSYSQGTWKCPNILDTDSMTYDCSCFDYEPPEEPTPLPTETPTAVPTPIPDNGTEDDPTNGTAGKVNSTFMEGYYSDVDDVFANLTNSTQEGFGVLTGPVVELTEYINTVNGSLTTSFNQSAGHKSILIIILSSFFAYLPSEIQGIFTLSIIFILVLLILRGNSGGQ